MKLTPAQIKFITAERERIRGILSFKPNNPFDSFSLQMELQTYNIMIKLHNVAVNEEKTTA